MSNRCGKRKTRKRVWRRDGRKCRYCGTIEGPFHLAHYHPFSRGGPSSYDNLRVACYPCGTDKGSKSYWEWKEIELEPLKPYA